MPRIIKPLIYKTLRNVLPVRLRQAIVNVGFNIAREQFGRSAFLYAFAPDMKQEMLRLKQRGWSPASVVDVGAYRGEWSQMARSVWPEARLAMVEPNSKSIESLRALANELNAELHGELLGSVRRGRSHLLRHGIGFFGLRNT